MREQLDFRSQRLPLYIAALSGLVSCLCAGLLGWAAFELADHGVGSIIFFASVGVLSGAFGAWMLLNGWRMSKLRAHITTEALHLNAQRGRSLWLPGPLEDVVVPWAEVQGFSHVDFLNPGAGVQSNYILYTNRGDFTLNDVQWDNLPGLLEQISSHTGRRDGEVASERSAAQIELAGAKRRMFSIQRIFGWCIFIVSAALLLLVIVGGLVSGFNVGLAKALGVLGLAMSLGGSMARFYRRR
jgi:hypothetical protein